LIKNLKSVFYSKKIFLIEKIAEVENVFDIPNKQRNVEKIFSTCLFATPQYPAFLQPNHGATRSPEHAYEQL
jgi:hypothetical protein